VRTRAHFIRRRVSGCGTNGCLARWGNSRSPTFPQPRARPVIQGVVDNGYALIVFWQQYRNSAVQWLARNKNFPRSSP
jgi:hypothetical protein